MTARAVLAWCALLVVMFANGTVRVLVLQPRLGEARARQVASLSGVLIVLAASATFVRATPWADGRQLLGVGVVWLALTLAFEFGFGRFVSGQSWQALLEDYDVLRGRLWILIPVATLVGPWLCAQIARRS